ncbi:MAG: LysE family translocator [Acidimicrobiales bacterium]
MVDTRSLTTFAVTAFLLIIVPGPSVLFVISRGVALGRRAALLTVVGNAAGVLVQVLVVAAGLGAVLERSTVLFDAVRLAGAAYLVYLGVQAIRHRRELSTVLDVTGVRPSRHILREGFVVGVTNPKLIVFFTAVLPQFVEPTAGPVPVQLLIFGGVFVAIALVMDSCWGLAAGTARTWLAGKPHRLERLGGAGGLVIIGLGARLALTGRKD